MSEQDKKEPRDEAVDDAAQWRFGEFTLDERVMELRVGGEKLSVPRKPLDLLMFMLRNPGEVLTKDELFEAVWPGRIVSETALTNAILKLRTALGDGEQKIVKSVYGYGYLFAADDLRNVAAPQRVELPAALGLRDGDAVPHRAGWVLHKRLGAGGGGEAWLAMHDQTFEPRVFKFARDVAALSALKREITLGKLLRASLGEPENLVRVLDANLDAEPFFIGLEHCSEGSLADWAEAAGGVRMVDISTRLDLLAQAAEALAGAHRMGVLHKDLKPSNLLLQRGADGRLMLKLADFGSARLIDRHRLLALNITALGFTQTVVNASSGTPLYLAPEMLTGSPASTRSDVYALGVILYQLVVGDLRRALAPGWERDIEDPLLVEDISAAAAGDPERRLSDAAQLAARLRTLDARRVERERQLAEARASEATRLALDRTRARRGLLVALVVTLVVGLIATGLLFLRANTARMQAQESAKLATRSANLALNEAARANAVASFLTDDLLSAGNPEIAGRRTVTVREVLDAAQTRLAGRFKDQPRVEATLQRVLGTAYAALGEREPAARLLGKAEQALATQAGPAAAETQAARMRLRDMHLYWFDSDAAEATLKRVLDAENAEGRPNLELALEAEAQFKVLSCWAGFMSIYVARCDAVADQGYHLALEKLGPDSRATLMSAADAADSRLKTGRAAEALPLMRAAHEGMRTHYPESRFSVMLFGFLVNQALILSGHADEALQPVAQDVARFAAIYGHGSRYEMIARRWHARARLELGDAQAALAELDEIRSTWLMQEQNNLGLPHDYAWIESERARCLMRLQRPAEAATALRDGMTRVSAREQPTGYWTMTLRDQLADARLQLRDPDSAEKLLRQNLADARSVLKKGEWLLGWCAYRLGADLAKRGPSNTEARSLLAEAVPILEQTLGKDEARTRQARAAVEAG